MADIVLSGSDLDLASLVRAAREPGRVELAPGVVERMAANRAFAERVAARGDGVYGLTRGVGARRERDVAAAEAAAFNRRLLREHATGQGPTLPEEEVRAAALCLLNQLAAGRANARPGVAQAIAERLGSRPLPPVRMYGVTGMGDLAPLADLVIGLIGDVELAPGEALPLIGQSSFVTAQAALAVHDTRALLDCLAGLTALDVEAYAANPSAYDPAAGEVRPYPGYRWALDRLWTLLEGSRLHAERPRHLQSPLSYRDAAPVLGAAHDALAYAEGLVAIELNAHQQNPLALPERDAMLPVANFDLQAVAAALDLVRIALAPCLTMQVERSIKLLQASETDLTTGLEPRGDRGGHGYSEMAWPLQGIGAEARLLHQPVSAEVGSASQAEGIEDRMTMAQLGARRTREMAALGFRVAAIGAVFACQAIDLRGADRLGPPLADRHARVRAFVPGLGPGDPPPDDLEPLVAALRGGLLG
jgi:histidine ammonia-lyase